MRQFAPTTICSSPCQIPRICPVMGLSRTAPKKLVECLTCRHSGSYRCCPPPAAPSQIALGASREYTHAARASSASAPCQRNPPALRALRGSSPAHTPRPAFDACAPTGLEIALPGNRKSNRSGNDFSIQVMALHVGRKKRRGPGRFKTADSGGTKANFTSEKDLPDHESVRVGGGTAPNLINAEGLVQVLGCSIDILCRVALKPVMIRRAERVVHCSPRLASWS